MAAHDPVALAEIDLYGDLIIAAAATPFDRLSADRIDQVLQVRPGEPVPSGPPIDPGEPAHPGQAVDPAQPVHPGEPFRPGQPVDPGEPVAPEDLRIPPQRDGSRPSQASSQMPS